MSREGPSARPRKAAPSRRPSSPPAPTRCRRSGAEARGAARTFQAHPDRQALLEAAEGTALALRLVDLAALALGARVVLVVLHRALEEALGRGGSAGQGPSPLHLPAGLRPVSPRRPPARHALPGPAGGPLTLQLSHVSSP